MKGCRLSWLLWCAVLGFGVRAAPKDAKDLVPDDYLEQFGYLDERKAGAQHDETSRTNAISEFQKLWKLKVTGNLNKETITKMLSPRCGLPDVIRPSDRQPPGDRPTVQDPRQPLQFNAQGFKWDHKRITYKFVGFTRQLPQSSQRRAIQNAFAKWAAVTPLTFVESRDNDADILIKWTWGNHNDGSPFDGRGGTLAHAFFPGRSPIAGDTHFDEQEEWTENTKRGTNLEIVAAHELGHALGLGHSSTEGALMQPFYSGYIPNFQLHSDDIRGVQHLYGSKPAARPTPRPTSRPRQTTRRPRYTSRPRVTTKRPDTKKDSDPTSVCELKFDDIANGPDGRLYAFRERKIYKINSNGVGIDKKFPRLIRKVFPKGPSYIGAAVYDRWRRKFYIFKGSRLWRYSGFTLDSGYPKRIARGWYRKVQAALQSDNGEIFLLKGKEVSVWRGDWAQPPRGYPINITTRWPTLRDNLEAAVRYNRVDYFFKGNNYFRYDDRYRKVLYKKNKAGPWLGCGRVGPK